MYSRPIKSSREVLQRRKKWSTLKKALATSMLILADADEMLVKAQLASKISEIITARKWSQQQGADVLGISQPKLSKMLRGQFRGISEAKMLDCLARLGRDVQIVIGSVPRRRTSTGHVAVVFA